MWKSFGSAPHGLTKFDDAAVQSPLGWIIRIKEQQKALYLVCSVECHYWMKIQLLIWLLFLRMDLNRLTLLKGDLTNLFLISYRSQLLQNLENTI